MIRVNGGSITGDQVEWKRVLSGAIDSVIRLQIPHDNFQNSRLPKDPSRPNEWMRCIWEPNFNGTGKINR
ncbi:hypothetical protein CEXT_218711 [Caerostris extrusa]|uniref:Uncharacterized protein n=1 Tax=Caerostris extrusa TaxID=172846 RepID=A0AAV4X8X4_CAEEX|nr:hypothetical protein CEXT_218711 [Caerostris extrusa]